MARGQIYAPTASAPRKHHKKTCGILMKPECISVFVLLLITQHVGAFKKETTYCIGKLATSRHTTKQNANI